GEVVSAGPDCDWRINGSAKLRDSLKSLGLWGCRADTKFIPELYLRSSVKERKMLLRGLMDGDGTIARGHGSYTTVSTKLKDDVVELCRSLGGVPTSSSHESYYLDTEGDRVPCL